MKNPTGYRQGFTMIELLTVIAIIAVLAALLFPVFNRVRAQTRQTQCMTQLHDVYVDLKIYREDNNKYPASLLGYAQDASGGFYTGSGDTRPIDQLTYKPIMAKGKNVHDKGTFLCPVSPNNDPKAVTNALYPENAGTGFANQPVVFTELIHHNIGDDKSVPEGNLAYFYKLDSYDVGPRINREGKPVLDGSGQPIMELHYSLDWTGNADPTSDAPNQLKYRNPPEDTTVVTWCTYHAAVSGADKIPALMLSGKVSPAPVSAFVDKGPLGFRP